MCKAEMNLMKSTSLRAPSTTSKKVVKVEKKPAGPTKFKKAPGAPRRFKSAFIFFSTQKHKEIRQGLGKAGEKEKTTNVAKMVSEAWKNLPSPEREYWEEMARKDKERYEAEKAAYKGPWKVPAEKPAKDPNAPKRPMSAFLSYSNSKRSEVKKQHPHMTNAEVSRILAKMWKKATDEEKHDFVEREYQARKNYKDAMAQWKATIEQRKETERLREIEQLQSQGEGPDPTPSLANILDMAHDELNDVGESFDAWGSAPVPVGSTSDFSLDDSFAFDGPQSFFDPVPEQPSSWQQQQPQQQQPPPQYSSYNYNYDGAMMGVPPPAYNYHQSYRYHAQPTADDYHQYQHVFDPSF